MRARWPLTAMAAMPPTPAATVATGAMVPLVAMLVGLAVTGKLVENEVPLDVHDAGAVADRYLPEGLAAPMNEVEFGQKVMV